MEIGTGPVFLYSTGAVEILHVAQPEIVKDMGHWTPMEREKPHYLMKSFKPPFGEGMMTANDGLSTCEKILAPKFLMEKIKDITFYLKKHIQLYHRPNNVVPTMIGCDRANCGCNNSTVTSMG